MSFGTCEVAAWGKDGRVMFSHALFKLMPHIEAERIMSSMFPSAARMKVAPQHPMDWSDTQSTSEFSTRERA